MGLSSDFSAVTGEGSSGTGSGVRTLLYEVEGVGERGGGLRECRARVEIPERLDLAPSAPLLSGFSSKSVLV